MKLNREQCIFPYSRGRLEGKWIGVFRQSEEKFETNERHVHSDRRRPWYKSCYRNLLFIIRGKACFLKRHPLLHRMHISNKVLKKQSQGTPKVWELNGDRVSKIMRHIFYFSDFRCRSHRYFILSVMPLLIAQRALCFKSSVWGIIWGGNY